MKRYDLISREKTWIKSNLHCHTVISDGNLTAEEIKAAYKKEGYGIVAFTDHRKYGNHKQLNDDNFLVLAAFEADINQFADRNWDFSRLKTYHINFYDVKPDERGEICMEELLPKCTYAQTEELNRYVCDMNLKGFLACYNHPYWSMQNYDDYKDLKGFWGMEIYNYGCEHDGLYGYNPQSYDEMLRTGQRLYCVSTDDNHNSTPFDDPMCDSFGGFTMIGVDEFNYHGVIKAMQEGSFYSSLGPKILEAYMEGMDLVIKTEPVEKIFVITEGRACHKSLAKPGETIEEARFTLKGNEGYIRISVRDGKGKAADSNAFFLDEFMSKLV